MIVTPQSARHTKPPHTPTPGAMRGFSFLVFSLLLLLMPITASADTLPWIVDASHAKKLLDDGATLLDARGKWAYTKGHLQGAVRADWTDFTPSKRAERGELLPSDAALSKKLEELGVQDGRPVVVVDDPVGGWGEAGRIVWMLRTLGHDQAAWVDGGHDALQKRGLETTILPVKAKKSSGFTIKRTDAFRATRDEVRTHLGDGDTVFVDTREEREFQGKTPYGESRGGHLPGAKHLWFKDLLDANGKLKPKSDILKLLAARGITPDKKVVAYCTGGVRSGWFTGVLHHVGFARVGNYAGSMWEWSSKPAPSHPLE